MAGEKSLESQLGDCNQFKILNSFADTIPEYFKSLMYDKPSLSLIADAKKIIANLYEYYGLPHHIATDGFGNIQLEYLYPISYNTYKFNFMVHSEEGKWLVSKGVEEYSVEPQTVKEICQCYVKSKVAVPTGPVSDPHDPPQKGSE